MCRVPLLAALVSAVMLAGVAHAQVYKWVDDKGVVNYSNSPPPKGKGVVKLDEDRVTTIHAPEARRDESAAAADPALRRRVDELEREAASQRQSAAQQEAAAAGAQRRWIEQCRAERRVDCDDPGRGDAIDPGYGYAYPPAFGGQRPQRPGPAPFAYQPTPHVVQGGGGVVGPYLRPPPGGVVVGPGPYGIGAGYNRASPGGVVLAPGPGGVGAQYVPVPESAAPQPRPTPRQRPVPLQQ
jgi:hypothetical protein